MKYIEQIGHVAIVSIVLISFMATSVILTQCDVWFVWLAVSWSMTAIVGLVWSVVVITALGISSKK